MGPTSEVSAPLSFDAGPDGRTIRRGARGEYHWLTATGDLDVGTLLDLCPESVLPRHLAITSYDCGACSLTKAGLSAGWSARGSIA